MSRSFRNETAFSQAAQERIRDVYRGHARKVHASGMTGRGEPDLDAAVPTSFGIARSVKLELKQPGNRPTAAQMGAMRRWEAAGALAGWVTSLEELDELLSHVSDPTWRNPQLEEGRSPIVLGEVG